MDRQDRPVKAAPLRIFRMNPANDKRAAGTIAICTRDSISAGTAMSWLMLDFPFLSALEYVGRFFIQGNVLTMQRNACLTEMEGDWILFIDDDMTFAPDALARLLETQKKTGADIVGGLCFQRGEPFQPTLYREKDGKGYTFMEVWDEGDIIDVDATGLAFLLITTQALRKIIARQTYLMTIQADPLLALSAHVPISFEDVEWPDREVRRRYPPNFFQWMGDYGEDFGFCKLARDAGCRIVVDTGVEIGHVGEITITRKHFLREVAFRDDETYLAKKELADSVGIETMTAGAALTLLGLNVAAESDEDLAEALRSRGYNVIHQSEIDPVYD